MGLALKRVIGEDAGIGPCSGKMTTALPKPVPTIAPGQSLRAWAVVVAANLPGVQTGRPLVSTLPCLSNQRGTVSRTGGGDPSSVEIFPKPCSLIGAKPFFGSVVGVKPPSAVTTRLEAWSTIAAAEATTTSRSTPASTCALNRVFLTKSSLPLAIPPNYQPWQGGSAGDEGGLRESRRGTTSRCCFVTRAPSSRSGPCC